jgi:tetratricopeptide (TPR) repeat protein
MAAEREFRFARLVDPHQPKAYREGAIALINLGMKMEAAALVESGLQMVEEQNIELPQDDQSLVELLEKIFIDAGQTLTRESEAEQDKEKALTAVSYFDRVMTSRGTEDPDLYFDRGVAYLAAGSAVVAASEATSVVEEAKGYFLKAAENFAKARELVPDTEENAEYRKNVLFNQTQALVNAEQFDAAMESAQAYLGLDFQDSSMWRIIAMCQIETINPEAGVPALTVSNSLSQGQAVPPADATQSAEKEEAAALQEMGPPDAVYTYQEKGGAQIRVWFWKEPKKAVGFKLGLKSVEATW